MPEEHTGVLGFEYAWNELLRRARSSGPFLVDSSSQFDRSIFTLSWKPVISALSYAFTHFTDDHMLQRAIAGFQQCAALAERYGLPEVFDYTIHSLSKITGLCASQLQLETSMTFPTVDIDGQTVTVSALSLKFGTSFKSQLAAVVLFSIANENTPAIRMSWFDVSSALRYLRLADLAGDLRNLPNLVHALLTTSIATEYGRIPGWNPCDTSQSPGKANGARREEAQ